MKSRYIIICLILLVGITSCRKEYEEPDDNVVCSVNYDDHPKNMAYQSLLDEYTQKGLIGLSVLTDSPQLGTWEGASGYAKIENNIEMTSCHLHHTASIFKTFAAVVIIQMAEEGKFQLDEKAASYLPSDIVEKLPNGKEFTIRQLLQHRTGMVDVFEFDFINAFFNNPNQLYTIEELLAFMEGTKAQSEPGTDFYYSDANYLLLALIINKFDGDYVSAMNNRIVKPLGMTDTYIIDKPEQHPDGLANSYWDRYGKGKIENVSDIQIATTAGLRGTDGIIGSTEDLKIFIKAIFDGRLISSSSLAEMADAISVPEEETTKHGIVGYGLGLMQASIGGKMWYGHFGNHVGSGAILLYNPESEMTIVAFTNRGTFFSDDIKPTFFGFFLNNLEGILAS